MQGRALLFWARSSLLLTENLKNFYIVTRQRTGVFTVSSKCTLQCCSFGIFIPDPDFFPSQIPTFSHPESNNKKEGKKLNLLSYPFFCSHIFHKLKLKYFIFVQKILLRSQKIWVGSGIQDPRSRIRDPGYGKSLFQVPDLGVKKALDPKSRSATLVHCSDKWSCSKVFKK